MKRSLIRTVIFDLDGTLIDTEKAAAIAVTQAFTSWGAPITSSDASYTTGRTWESAFDFLFAKYHPTVPRKKAEDEILDRYRAALETHLIVVPGSCEAVRSLAAEFALGLVSGSHRREILWALNKLDLLKYFKVILGAEDYPKSKPAPDGYQKAMKELGATPEGTVIFEDSQAGIASGRAVGAWVVAITSTNHFGQETAQSHCQIQDFTNVTPEWVRGKFLAPV